MTEISVSITTDTLMRLLDGPALLSKRVTIGNYIVDAIVINAHPDVAHWYGFDDPKQMKGLYLSQLHDQECLARVRFYAFARLLGYTDEIPDSYDMQICLPNGQHRWLRKLHVRQIREGEDVFWVSRSVPIPSAEAKPLLAPAISIPTYDLKQLNKWVTVAEAERILGMRDDTDYRPAQVSNIVADRLDMYLTSAEESSAVSYELPLGDPQYRRWVHRCMRCERQWVSGTTNPKRCQRCKSPYWHLGRIQGRGLLESQGLDISGSEK